MRWAKIIAINAALTAVLAALVEGGASYLLFSYKLLKPPGRPAQSLTHKEFDPQIGWINLPNTRVEDMYGPGATLTTNSQRFRAGRDFTVAVPDGKVRLFCSGDSFTLGYGVDDERTWCRQLEILDDRLETVNLGQTGYGVDQVYLWYQRNQVKLEHDILVFALIEGDFVRAAGDRFWGNAKPRLTLREGKIVEENTPLRQSSGVFVFTREKSLAFRSLRTPVFIGAVAERLGIDLAPKPDYTATREMVSALFADLDRTQKENGRRWVLLYIPTALDFFNPARRDPWREFVAREALGKGYLFIDLVEEMHRMPTGAAQALFQGPPWGHLTNAGNEFIARQVIARLDDPQIDALIRRSSERAD